MKTTIYELPFYRELSDFFEQCHTQPMAIFLDSALENQYGRFSIVGLSPYRIVFEENETCFLWDLSDQTPAPETFDSTDSRFQRVSHSFETEMDRYLSEHFEENPTELPLISGAIGYLSYDYGRKFEQIQTRHPKRIQMPDALFLFYDLLLIQDKQNRTLTLAVQGKTCTPPDALGHITRLLEHTSAAPFVPKHETLAFADSDFSKADYQKTIQRLIEYIVEGDVYITNLTQQLCVKSKRAPYDMYRYLRTHNPAPFAAYCNYGSFQIASASPERFLLVKDRQVQTRPIKGTRPRGKTPAEDATLREELLHSSKDRSELLMIVDLERNDFSRVCEINSVKVPELFTIEAYATVFHLVSTITGTLRPDVGLMDLISAAFPGGSITGAPKIRAMELIDTLEHNRRGLYTGSLGYLSMDKNCDLNIIIRTAVYQNQTYFLGMGGGITSESDISYEYDETLQKAKALLEAIAEGGMINDTKCR
ncbi:MAG: aminodeoxychorismate synthase component I [Lachnospiraceae bacterium]